MRKLLITAFFIPAILTILFCNNDDPVKPKEYAPVLSKLVVPDTIFTNTDSKYIASIKVEDGNGLDDITEVNYQIFTDGGQLVKSGPMFDDGNYDSHGDNVAHDGKYSILLGDAYSEGTYRIVIEAADQTELESEPAEANFYVKEGLKNNAPSVSKISIPDTVFVDEILPFKLSVNASDDDSLDYISSVNYQIFGPTITELTEEGELVDDGTLGDVAAGDGVYTIETTTEFGLWKFGDYHIYIFAVDSKGKVSNSIYELLSWGKKNLGVPPEVVGFSLPDTVKLPSTGDKSFVISIKATDPDNNKDVKEVYFKTYKPSGIPASDGKLFGMYDDGSSGDETAGDNIFSLRIYLESTNEAGNYRFEFKAKDYSNLESSTFIHIMTVIE